MEKEKSHIWENPAQVSSIGHHRVCREKQSKERTQRTYTRTKSCTKATWLIEKEEDDIAIHELHIQVHVCAYLFTLIVSVSERMAVTTIHVDDITVLTTCMRISTNHNSLGCEQPSRPRCRLITQCAGRVSANARPLQLRWGDRECGCLCITYPNVNQS